MGKFCPQATEESFSGCIYRVKLETPYQLFSEKISGSSLVSFVLLRGSYIRASAY